MQISAHSFFVPLLFLQISYRSTDGQPQNILPFIPSNKLPDVITREPAFGIGQNPDQPPPQPKQPGVNLDIYDPWKTTARPRGSIYDDEVVARIATGQVVGRKIPLPNLQWTPDRDVRDFRSNQETTNLNYAPQNVTVPVYTFLGVPYAQKPVGSLRFQKPQKLPRLPDELYVADRYRSACAQDIDSRATLWLERPYEYNVDEDCLYLNVFTPEVSLASAKSYPVIVFFHGGSFQTGASNDWPGYLLASKGVVVVTANYRLGAFGFLSLGGRMGNYGLWDQKMVLEWVQENVYAFSGDRSRVTVVGHDAGGVSAGLHMLSPQSNGLLSAVAAMSGSDLSYHSVITHPMLMYNNTVKLGNMVGCFSLNGNEIFECLKTRSTHEIVAGCRELYETRTEFNRFSFLPTVDQVFLPEPPLVMLKRKAVVSPLTYLTGVNLHDGAEVLLTQRQLSRTEFNVDKGFFDYYVRDYVLKRNYTTNREAVENAVKYLYTYWPDQWSDEKVRDQFIRMTTDAYYTAPVTLAAQLRSESGSMVFMYVNAYNFSTGALNPGQNFLPPWMSVCPDCDLYLLFGFPWMPKQFLPAHLKNVTWTDADKNASEIFMAMFKKYAETKNPNLVHENVWINYGPRDHNYLLFNSTRTLAQNFDWEHVAFWNNYIDQLADFFTTTFSPTVAGIRRELIVYKTSTGVVVFLLAVCVVVAGTMGYLLWDRPRRRAMQYVLRMLAADPVHVHPPWEPNGDAVKDQASRTIY